MEASGVCVFMMEGEGGTYLAPRVLAIMGKRNAYFLAGGASGRGHPSGVGPVWDVTALPDGHWPDIGRAVAGGRQDTGRTGGPSLRPAWGHDARRSPKKTPHSNERGVGAREVSLALACQPESGFTDSASG